MLGWRGHGRRPLRDGRQPRSRHRQRRRLRERARDRPAFEGGDDADCHLDADQSPPIKPVYLSFPEENTIVEINRATGELVGQYGKASGSYAFSPTWNFEYQHFANVTASGTLMVSSHMPGYTREGGPVAGKHAFIEFEVDRASKTLIQKWIYNESPEFPNSRGMAIRLPNGNTLGNYGPQGVIREVTPDKKTAFQVKFDVDAPDDFFNKMVGHNDLVDDLYSLNSGPAK